MYVKWAPAGIQGDSGALEAGSPSGIQVDSGTPGAGLQQGCRGTVGHWKLDSSRDAGRQWDTGSWASRFPLIVQLAQQYPPLTSSFQTGQPLPE